MLLEVSCFLGSVVILHRVIKSVFLLGPVVILHHVIKSVFLLGSVVILHRVIRSVFLLGSVVIVSWIKRSVLYIVVDWSVHNHNVYMFIFQPSQEGILM